MSGSLQNLIYFCAAGKIFNKKALAVLKGNSNLDLTSEDGLVFKHAVKHGNPELLGALLEYYQEHKLQGDRDSLEYRASLAPLRKIVDNLEYCYDLEEKGVAKALKPYLGVDEDVDSDTEELAELLDPADYIHMGVLPCEALDHQALPADDFGGWPAELLHSLRPPAELSGNHHEVEAH
jgi:hypothetical protein